MGLVVYPFSLQCRRPWFNSWVRKFPWRRDRLPTPVFLGFPGSSDGKESTCNAGDLGSIRGFDGGMGFPGGSAGKESACNAGDPDSIPGSGSSPGEGMGYPLQYSWASLVAQMIKNPPARLETCIRSLGWEDPLEEGMATHSNILVWRIIWTEELGGLQSVHRVTKSQTRLGD